MQKRSDETVLYSVFYIIILEYCILTMDGVDEDYEPRSGQPEQSAAAPSTAPSAAAAPSAVEHEGIVGLQMDIGAVVAPSAPDTRPRVPPGGRVVARFRQPRSPRSRSRSPSPTEFDFNFDVLGNGIGDDPEAAVRAFTRSGLTNLTTRFAREAAPEAVQHVDQVVSTILEQTPQQRRQQRQQQQQQQQQQHLFRYRELINAIVRECPNVRIVRLHRLIAAIERANLDESRLRERLRQLDQMLHMRHRTRSMINVTVSHSDEFMRAFRTLGCRGRRARRAFYALISELRDQVVHRLDELNQRRTRRSQPQQYTQPPASPTKGGARQTRKKTIKRNKTIKRR